VFQATNTEENKMNNKTKKMVCTPEHIMPVYRNKKLILMMAKDIIETDELYVLSNE
jgi:intein/homing endonuclease